MEINCLKINSIGFQDIITNLNEALHIKRIQLQNVVKSGNTSSFLYFSILVLKTKISLETFFLIKKIKHFGSKVKRHLG